MPRRREVEKRDVLPDPKYNNKMVAKFVNSLLKSGKKSTAESILYGAFDIIEKRVKEQPVELFEKALNNLAELCEIHNVKVLNIPKTDELNMDLELSFDINLYDINGFNSNDIYICGIKKMKVSYPIIMDHLGMLLKE